MLGAIIGVILSDKQWYHYKSLKDLGDYYAAMGDLKHARSSYEQAAAAAPDDVDAAIWVGRRFGYLGRFREAIEVYSKALVKHPDSPQLLRHRGHRYLTLRRFHDAVNDLERAQRLVAGKPDVPEPDGLPNAANIPLSTLQSNIRYHLGVASYMLGDYARAADVLRESLESATNDDRWCSEGYWLYLTLRRLGRKADADLLLAPVSKDMQILENFSYQKLLLFFRGEGKAEALLAAARKDPDASAFPTIAYGIAMSRQFAGDAAGARELLEQITSGDNWPSFGYIGAEVDLARAAGRPVR